MVCNILIHSYFTINDFNPQSSQQWHISCLNEETMALQDIKWLQTITRLPILVKGVLTAEDGKVFLFPVTDLSLRSMEHLQICSSNCYQMRRCGYYHFQPRWPPAWLSSGNHQLPRRGMLNRIIQARLRSCLAHLQSGDFFFFKKRGNPVSATIADSLQPKHNSTRMQQLCVHAQGWNPKTQN
jgi:hypothetical protein